MTEEKFAYETPDLYDWEMAHIEQVIAPKLYMEFSRKRNTPKELEEFQKVAFDEFLKIGLVVEVNIAKALFDIGPPDIEIIRRVPGHSDNKYGHDHEAHRVEVLKGNSRGEKYLGEKGPYGTGRKKMR